MKLTELSKGDVFKFLDDSTHYEIIEKTNEVISIKIHQYGKSIWVITPKNEHSSFYNAMVQIKE
jgi:hypothetical protein